MEIKNYIIGKLVPDMLRQKIIDIKGSTETEFINIDSVEVTELNEAFALTKPFAVDVTLSRYCERDVKHLFHLVVKVSVGVCFTLRDTISFHSNYSLPVVCMQTRMHDKSFCKAFPCVMWTALGWSLPLLISCYVSAFISVKCIFDEISCKGRVRADN